MTKKTTESGAAPRATARKKATRATIMTARKVARFAWEKKAEDIMIMDLRKVTDMTSFFVLCSGNSGTQVKAIADSIQEQARKAGLEIYAVEGYDSQRWILIDMIDIVVHVFLPDVRAYYQLERLWGDAPVENIGGDEARVAR
ncbi:MAG TPA: ribosome silencing factor [Candidatus Krumholzibacteria bacterium]|nr:ribosome silencing factor [Candidatus Krumholzibacteria bacterium]